MFIIKINYINTLIRNKYEYRIFSKKYIKKKKKLIYTNII